MRVFRSFWSLLGLSLLAVCGYALVPFLRGWAAVWVGIPVVWFACVVVPGLALSRLGRHDEAIACSDEAAHRLEGARPEGAEHIHRWRAEVLAAAGKVDAARAALERASAEIEAKAAKLRDPELRRLFLASRRPAR
jgi:tetratricopeptide (TPR) repeat protein